MINIDTTEKIIFILSIIAFISSMIVVIAFFFNICIPEYCPDWLKMPMFWEGNL